MQQSRFVGGVSTIAVEVAGHGRPLLLTKPGASDVADGQQVELSWPSERAVLLPDPPA